ncbi:hypothetical protein B4N89_13460 [Embleya scabrispora]|uniref:Uncharacterized protein n=1 Tax=Embleya scabrispora TaxID=159449 RepID=A0A1T3NYA3_9ACTN|nr:hypothetical protein [Embleya scabrispora]OPC81808.1 hypothetical protein B4N89_13460 [Embleya scabrispora]
MYLVYHPEGAEEPTRWRYDPRRLMSVEREDLERRTDRSFGQFTKDVVEGHALCRRALLFTFLRREHPKLRFGDVDFAWDELTLEFSRAELLTLRAEAVENLRGDELAAVLSQLDTEIETAYDDRAHEGKAPPPTAD